MSSNHAPLSPVPAVDPADVASASGDGLDELTATTLARLPALGQALAAARAIDRQVALLLDGLADLVEHDLAETVTGVPLEQWLAIVGRRTASDRRMLLAAVDALRRLPSLRQAFCQDATVSWAQLRAIALRVQRTPRRADELIDGELARTIAVCQHDEPDTLLHAISRALTGLDDRPAPAPDPTPPADEFLAIQPRLDGTGGQLYGELGPLSLATVDAALTPNPDQLDDPSRGAVARARAARLVTLCDHALDGADDTPAAPDRNGASSQRAGSRPQLLIRVPLTTLLDHDDLPGELLTRLTGGKLWADATTIRRLVDQRGADLRTIILDDTGQVVGVGRRSRIAPGWLADATLALHDTCSFPSCTRPARACDTDHAHPWWPVRPDQPPGRTDIDQLAPLCRHHNRTKETGGWHTHQNPDGTRHWHHPATGLTTTTRPATWQPPPHTAPGSDHNHADPGRSDLAHEQRARYDPPQAPDRANGPGEPDLAHETAGTYHLALGRSPPADASHAAARDAAHHRRPGNRRRPASRQHARRQVRTGHDRPATPGERHPASAVQRSATQRSTVRW